MDDTSGKFWFRVTDSVEGRGVEHVFEVGMFVENAKD